MIPDFTENNSVELKLKLNDKLEKSVVGFLNSKTGGDIYIGIDNDGNIDGVNETDKTQLVTAEVTEQVTEQVKRLVEILEGNELSVKEIINGLELKHRPTVLYDYIKPALENGIIEMTQPDSPKSPTQKYRLTEKGNGIGKRLKGM